MKSFSCNSSNRMDGFKMIKLVLAFQFAVFCLSTYAEAEECRILNSPSDTISDSATRGSRVYERCWTIKVPEKKYVVLKLNSLQGEMDCSVVFLEIKVPKTNEEYKYCASSSSIIVGKITAFSDMQIIYHVASDYSTRRYGHISYGSGSGNSRFEVNYETVDILCTKTDIFRCSDVSCISKTQVCDGRRDCADGKDESGCETGLKAIKGIGSSRDYAISWLTGKRTPSWGWRENTHRAIIALYLGSKNNFPSTDLKNELMIKQLELKTSLAILRNGTDPLSPSQLGLLINALLVTCHDPHHFYGFDLVKVLKNELQGASKSAHPMAHLALCNANESLPTTSVDKLVNVLNSSSDYPFLLDVQAISFVALSCMLNNSKYDQQVNKTAALRHYGEAIKKFQSFQNRNGSFGNAYTTALITQALLSGGQELNKDWNLEAAVKYLMQHLQSPSVDFLATSLTLPILNGKSLADIAKYNCTKNPRGNGSGKSYFSNSIVNIENKLGLKMTVKYSLYIGDEKDIVHTISLRVPENITVYELMQLAEVADTKYKFESKETSGKLYVYEIAGITNDPEVEKFWLMYIISETSGESLSHYTDSPGELEMLDGEHLVMWYKTAHI